MKKWFEKMRDKLFGKTFRIPMDEIGMRENAVPYLQTEEDLIAYIRALLKRPHDYGTCVYATSMASVAAFKYMAHHLRVSGAQASYADMDIIRRTRLIEGPFAIVNAEKMLYPQYNIRADVETWLRKWLPWASDEARKLLLTNTGEHVSPVVIEHWRKLVKLGEVVAREQHE